MLQVTLLLAFGVALDRERTAGPPPTPEAIRQSIARSLTALEKGAADWKNGNNQVGVDHGKPVLVPGTQAACASCHHVPMTFWCLTEAKNRGLEVDAATVDEFRSWSLTPYLKDPNVQPFNQDKFNNAKTSLNTIYLSLALFASAELDAQSTEAVKKFAAHLLAKQEVDGSWKSGRTGYEPPIGDDTEVLTMQSLQMLLLAHDRGLAPDGVEKARDRTLAWLDKNKPGDRNQVTNLRLWLAHRFGKSEEIATLDKAIFARQNRDGGWSQVNDRPSDALATGQTLYMLSATGHDLNDNAMQQAAAFLLRAQLADGSWWVPSRDKGRKGLAISHYGSGWATLGLLQFVRRATP